MTKDVKDLANSDILDNFNKVDNKDTINEALNKALNAINSIRDFFQVNDSTNNVKVSIKTEGDENSLNNNELNDDQLDDLENLLENVHTQLKKAKDEQNKIILKSKENQNKENDETEDEQKIEAENIRENQNKEIEETDNEQKIETKNEHSNPELEVESSTLENENNEIEQEKINEKIKNPVDLENQILTNLIAHTQNNNFFYNKDDLTNFHIALKSGDFVILAGKSGTGKSKLTQLYAESLGTHYKLIPVKPSWNDDSDLIGFFDSNTNIYQSDENSFIDFLIEAEAKPNEMFIVCLDEMNLARVEYYFSKFLSKLQTMDRKIELFNKNLKSLNRVNPVLNVGDNIKFVGTINLDETTFNLSDKVLDRANVVSLDILDFTTDWVSDGLTEKEITVSYNDFSSLLNNNDFDKETVRNFLWDLNKVLKEYNFEFGPRVLVDIENYLSNLTKDFSLDKGLDYQVKQRIITKLRGPEETFKGLFQEFEKILDKYKDLSSFPISREALKSKRDELKVYGFTR